MIDIQLLEDVLLAVAVLVGAAILLTVAMVVAATVSKPAHGPYGQGPHGGIRRDPVPQPEPDTDDARQLVLR